MAKVFEMTRRASQPLECDDCGDTIEAGQRWYFRRVKRKYGWEESHVCEECAVFGPPEYSVFDPFAFAPDR